MRLDHLELYIQDMDRAYRFYTKTLGLRPVRRQGDTFAALFTAEGGLVLWLRGTHPPVTGHGAPVVAFFAEGGVEKRRSELEALGVQFRGPTSVNPGGSEAWFLDSEGNTLALYEPAPTRHFREVAEARSMAEMRAMMAALGREVEAAIASLSEAQGSFRPGPEEWSIAEALSHVIATVNNRAAIIADIGRGVAARRPPFPVERPGAALAEVRAEVPPCFAHLLDVIDSLGPEPDLDTRFSHPAFGPLNCKEFLACDDFHTRDHLKQIEAVKAAADFPRS